MGLLRLREALAGTMVSPRRSAAPPAAIPMSGAISRALLAIALGGAVLSLYLTYVHYRLHRDPQWQSACNFTDAVNCDQVLLSPFASIAGLPLSVAGALLYGAILAVVVIDLRGKPHSLPRSPAIVVFVASAVAVATSVILLTLSLSIIGATCLFCATLHLVNIGLLAFAWRGVKSTRETLRSALEAEVTQWGGSPVPSTAVVAFGLVVLLVARQVYAKGTVAGSEVCGAVAAVFHQGRDQVIELTVFSDFQCPHCRALDEALRGIRRGPRLSVRQEHFPLEAACNRNVQSTAHPGACVQARAVLCAESLGHGADFRRRLFDDGATNADALVKLAVGSGAQAVSFERCLTADETFARLRASIERGIAAGVRGTPTSLINGRRHVGGFSVDDVKCLAGAGALQ